MSNNYQLQTTKTTTPIIHTPEMMRSSGELANISFALAEQTAFNDKLKAALTKQVMDNVAGLASTEAYYNQIAPTAKEDFRKIIQTYARMAMFEIWGGEF